MRKKIVYYVLMFLPFVITLIALQYLPEQIPAHYDADNHVDRWGSKYETLVLPVISFALGEFLLLVANRSLKKGENEKHNERTSTIFGIVYLMLFNILTYYFLYTDFHQVEDLSELSIDIGKLSMGMLGIIMLVVGNLLPKIRMNHSIGLRTKWSQKNEFTWKKSQIFGGICSVCFGFIMLIMSFLLKGYMCFVGIMMILLVNVMIVTLYTYKVARNSERI